MGTVSIPLFVTRWTFPVSTYPSLNTGWGFNSQSFAPQIGPQPLDSGTPNYTTLISIIADINAPCISLFNPTSGGAHSFTDVQTWIDDAICCNVTLPGTPNYNKFKQCFQSRGIADNSIEITNKNFGFWAGPNGNQFAPMPCIDSFGRRVRGVISPTNSGPADPYTCWGMLSDFGGPASFVHYPGFSPPAGLNFADLFAGVGPTNTYNAFGPFNLLNTTNYWMIPNNGRAAPWTHPLLAQFVLDPSMVTVPITQSLGLSNAALDAFFQGIGNTTPTATANGWVIRITTNGAGPTGQPYEFIYCTKDMTKYVILKFVPFGPIPITQLGRGTSGWTVNIDVNGVLYFNSGSAFDVDHICFSLAFYNVLFQTRFVPQFDIPHLKDVNIPPMKLPCFDPCPPSG